MVIFSFFLVTVAFPTPCCAEPLPVGVFGAIDPPPVAEFLLDVPAFAAVLPDPLAASFGWTTSDVLNG
jgi:hypothetical protein